MIGETIGSYTILRRLGEGGMGEVYLAEHKHIARRAAIKLLLPEFTTKTDVVSRFFTEARATSLIRHPGIVEILDCAVHTNGRAYIIMEFLDGESLASTLERVGNVSGQASSALAILGQIASALGAAHGKGIIHRDLKPDNVFLANISGESGLRVKILDFGIAKLAAEGQAALQRTRTGSLLGTPIYMSPEQCRGAGAVDHRTDIYSLGCIAYELFAGRPPFVKEGAGELLVAHMSETPRPLREVAPTATPELEDLVSRLLAKDPNKRPSSALEVVQALEKLLRTRASEFAALIEAPHGFPRTNGTSPARLAVSDEQFRGLGAFEPSGQSLAEAPSTGAPGPVGSTTNVATTPGVGTGLPGHTILAEPVIGGGTRLLAVVDEPAEPVRQPKTQTTFSRTASESITQNTRRTSPKAISVAVATAIVVGVGAIALWPKGHAPAPVSPTSANAIAEPGPKTTGEPHADDKGLTAAAKATTPGGAATGTAVGAASAEPTEDLPSVFELSSEPAGAEVWMPDEASPRGVTPLKLALPKGGGVRKVVLKASGFSDKEVALEPGHEGPLAVSLEAKAAERPSRGGKAKDDESLRPDKGARGDTNKDGVTAKVGGRDTSTPADASGKHERRRKKKDDSPYKAMGD